MSKWIRKNDKVVVIAGNDKGKSGTVLSRKDDRVIVGGVNIRKKHIKRTQKAESAQIISIERAIHVSNVALCTENGTKVKVKAKLNASGQKDLVFVEQGKEVLFRSAGKKGK